MTTRKTKQYVTAAVDSLTLSIELFNRPSPLGRDHATVMLVAHSFEMLLKAAIFETRRTVKFRNSDRSYDLGKCVGVAETDLKIIDAGDRIVLMALKEDRDTATHDVIAMTEDVLWIHMRSAVTIFRKVLKNLTGQNLTDLMPGRVLPVSAHPPTDVGLVVGQEMNHIRLLLAPGKRQGAEARAHLLPLLALDRAAQGVAEPATEKEISKIARAIKAGEEWQGLLPGIVGLQLVGSPTAGETAQEVVLRVDPKRGELAVRPSKPGEEVGIVPYREINTFDRFNIKLTEFGGKLGLTRQEGLAIVHALDLKSDKKCFYVKHTKNGGVTYQALSKVALDRVQAQLADGSLDVAAASAKFRKYQSDKAKNKKR